MDRRKESRLFVDVAGSYQFKDDTPRNVFISQISANGCRLANCGGDLCVGEPVQVSLGPIGPLDATVKWLGDDTAGVEFHAPIHPAILAHFAGYCRLAG